MLLFNDVAIVIITITTTDSASTVRPPDPAKGFGSAKACGSWEGLRR